MVAKSVANFRVLKVVLLFTFQVVVVVGIKDYVTSLVRLVGIRSRKYSALGSIDTGLESPRWVNLVDLIV